jgi:hypothetical protein
MHQDLPDHRRILDAGDDLHRELAVHPQEAVLQAAASEVVLDLALDTRRQSPALRRRTGGEGWVLPFDNPAGRIRSGRWRWKRPVNRPLGIPCHSSEGMIRAL